MARSGRYKARLKVGAVRHDLGGWKTARDAAIAIGRAALHFGLDVPASFPASSRRLGPASPEDLRRLAITQRRSEECASKYVGVQWIEAKRVWVAQAEVRGRFVSIRCQAGEEQAARVRDRLALHFFGRRARLNFPNERLRPATPDELRRELYRVRATSMTSPYRGVSRAEHGRWQAAIKGPDGRYHALGAWDDERAAAEAYDRASRFFFGERGWRNFPNRRLSAASPQELRARQRARTKATTTSRYLGVSRAVDGWRAIVRVGRMSTILGIFDDEEDAAIARDRVVLHLQGAKAVLNFPDRCLEPATVEQLREEQHVRFKETTTSQYTGVSWHTSIGLWRAVIQVDGREYELGHYADESDAARAYDRAALRLRGGGRINFPAARPAKSAAGRAGKPLIPSRRGGHAP